MLTRALQYNNYLTVHTQIRKKNYIVHFVTINNEEEIVKKGMYFPNCTECTEFIAFQTFRKMVRYPNSCITRIQDEIIKTIVYVQ